MSALSIQVPFPVFQDRDGQPLDNGYVWIGAANLYPITNPVVAYFDEALTIIAAQPLRTINGYISNAGTPAQVYVDGVNFSILVQDSQGSMVYNFPEGTGISPDASAITYDPPFTGSVPTTVQDKLAESVSVSDFGAVGDGVTNDTVAIQAAIAASSGKAIYFPAGTYMTNSLLYNSVTGISIVGENKYTTIIKLNAGQNNHLLGFNTSTDCSVQNITLDQNTANNTAGHGLRLGGIDGLTVNNVIIQNCDSYGIGFQAGTNKNIFLTNFEINGTGLDAIDFKDFNFDNENIVISNGIIKNYGLDGNVSSGCDIRGPVIITNLAIVCDNDLNVGFRFRMPDAQGRAGSGTASNIQVTLKSVNAAIGFVAESASNTDVTVSNVVVYGGYLAIISSANGIYKSLRCVGATGESLTVNGNNNTIDGLTLDGGVTGATRAIDLQSNASGNLISNFNLLNISGTDAIRIQAGSDNNEFFDGIIQSGKIINNGGVGTIIRNVKNFPTASNVISTDLAVDSTGSKVFTIAHGLSVTPALQDVALTLVQSTPSANDYTLRYLRLESTTSTNIVGRIFVDVASATPGAVVKVSALVRAMGS
jgi:hypothetical protein